jgi:hypothetical protein
MPEQTAACPPPNRPTHDALYHRLFSDPEVVAQLLATFVAGPWLDDLDLHGVERLNAKFQADTGERREGDMIWRIPRRWRCTGYSDCRRPRRSGPGSPSCGIF